MRAFFSEHQLLHEAKLYFSRGRLRSAPDLRVRVQNILSAVDKLGLDLSEPVDRGTSPILNVHTLPYLYFLKTAHARWKDRSEDWGDEVMSNIFVRDKNYVNGGVLGEAARFLCDGSAPIGEHTWTSIYWSAQTAIAGAHAILDGDKTSYALCRPSGHHARKDGAGGLCYLNNAAIAADILAKKMGKVALLDIDVHHGQGSQEIFYDRDDVLYVSTHSKPYDFYPAVQGFADERGEGKGHGYNINIPMEDGEDEDRFLEYLDEALTWIKLYEPKALVLSLGFDTYEKDPMGTANVTTAGFEKIGKIIRDLDYPTVLIQEGGYDYDSLESNLLSFFKGFGVN